MVSVGSGRSTEEETIASFLEIGLAARKDVETLLGPDWDWQGKRMLDFGCGAGRFLRNILDWAEIAEIHGSDLDRPMVDWAAENLCPPIAGVELNGFDPPLAYPDDHFDVVTAFSVFTHLGLNWAEWLLEVRRILKPGGMLIASILDEACAEILTEVPYEEDRVGMSVWAYASPHAHYVNVLHSHWWLREHWGRAFEILSIDSGSNPDESNPSHEIPGQGIVLARLGTDAAARELTALDLQREKPGEDRYVAAHRHQHEMFMAEADSLKKLYHDSEMKRALLEQAHGELLGEGRARSALSKVWGLLKRSG
jgi:SAM-dependent methyltransferase